MKTYKLLDIGFEPIKQRIKNMGIGLSILMLAINLFIHLREPSNSISPWITLPISVVIAGFAIYIGVNKSLKMQQDQWSSYNLLLDNNTITRKQAGTPDLKLSRTEITEIQEVQGDHLLIKTADRGKFIVISKYLDGYDEVKAQVAQWQALKVLPQQSILKQPAVWVGLVGFISLITVWVSQNIQIILPLGIPLILYFVWAMIEVQRSSAVDVRMKRNSLVGFVIVILIIGVKIWAFLPR